MEKVISYIRPELLIVAVILYFIGMLLKRSKLKDNFIPIILGLIGVVSCCVYVCIFEGFSFASIGIGFIQGLLCACASTYVNQVLKQMQKLDVISEDTAKKIEEKIK